MLLLHLLCGRSMYQEMANGILVYVFYALYSPVLVPSLYSAVLHFCWLFENPSCVECLTIQQDS